MIGNIAKIKRRGTISWE